MNVFEKIRERKANNEVIAKKIEEYQQKCNFLDKNGNCLCSSSGGYGNGWDNQCSFEECILMKIAKKLEVG